MATKGNKEENSNQKFGPVPHRKASTDQNKELDRLKTGSGARTEEELLRGRARGLEVRRSTLLT